METPDEIQSPELSSTVMTIINRGVRHIKDLEAEIANWARDNTRIIHHESPDGKHYEIEIKVLTPPPSEEWGQIFGDAIHRFRSALDAWMWEKANELSDRPIKAHEVQYPIANNQETWDRWCKKTGKYLDEFLVAALGELQPYLHTVEGQNALASLHKIDIIDKHQGSIKIELLPDSIGDTTFSSPVGGETENRAIVSQFEVDSTNGGVIRIDFDHAPLDLRLPTNFQWVAAFRTDAGIHNTSEALRIFAYAPERYPKLAEIKAARLRAAAKLEAAERDDDSTDDDDREK